MSGDGVGSEDAGCCGPAGHWGSWRWGERSPCRRSRLRVNGAILHPGGPGGPGGPGEVATSLNSLFRSVAPLGRSRRHLYSCIAIGKLETKHNDDDSLPHLPHLLGTRGRRWAKRFTLKFRKNPQRRAIPVPPFYKLEAVKILRSVSWSVLESRLNLSL